MKHLKYATGTCLVLAIAVVILLKSGSDSVDNEKIPTNSRHATASAKSSEAGHKKDARHPGIGQEMDSPQEPRALNLPANPVDEKSLGMTSDDATVPASSKRAVVSDDDILTRGGVLPAAPKTASAGDKAQGPRSIKSEDWKGAANLLVNALRAGDRFEVNHDQLMDFLRGKDLLGWPESSRNWIGDEMMTMLRQDMPGRAYGDLKGVAEDAMAPAAMRDYAIQHISHLVNDGVAGAEAVEFIRQAYESGDVQVAGTALISLYRISQQKPALLDVKAVLEMAEKSKESTDERLKITATAILHEVELRNRDERRSGPRILLPRTE
ncbi:MAG: hypothetical protein V4733_08465 [Verrucomicrobiota bacterium]